MKQHKRWLIVTTVLWAAAAALRWWQLSSAFETDPRLAIPFAPASIALLVLLIAAAVILALLARRQTISPDLKEDWGRALCAPGDKLYLTGLVLAGFLALAAGAAFLRQGIGLFRQYLAIRAQGGDLAGKNNGLLRLLTGAAAIALCPALIAAGRDALRGRRGGGPLRIGVICGCLWMMDSYRGHAADPVRWDYVPLILAVATGTLCFLSWYGLSCGTSRPRRTLWLAGMTVILSAAAMVEEGSLGAVLLLAAQAFAGLSLLYRLPRNLNDPPELPEEPRPEETMEDEPHA